MIDVIVISKDNLSDLIKTLGSIRTELSSINNIIIVDDSLESNYKDISEIVGNEKKITYCFQRANSIYNAFNVAMKHVRENYIFLNSGDILISGSLERVDGPILLSTIGLSDQKIKKIVARNDFFYWFCHQSVVFDKRFRQEYDEDYKIASDLDFYIRYVKQFGFPKLGDISTGVIGYDLSGLSSQNRFRRDVEYLKIYIKHNLYKQFVCFAGLMFLKASFGRYV